jgi:alpha-tubulin suppressor-like RCC1 family protein
MEFYKWWYIHSLATKTDGTLWSWGGNNGQGRLGLGDVVQYSSPVQIPGTTWSSISSGGSFSLAKKTDNTLWSWGTGGGGRLGQNDTIRYLITNPNTRNRMECNT